MAKSWGFQAKKVSKLNILKLWKASLFGIIFLTMLSFFSFVHEIVYADKTNLLKQISSFSSLSFLSKNNIPSLLASLILDYKNGKNILKDKYQPAIVFTENHLDMIISILGYSQVKNNILKIYNQFKPYKKDIFSLLGKNEEKRYLIILENTSEERPDGGFFGSFIELSLSGAHIKDFQVIDSYKVIFEQCNLTGSGWYQKCDKKKLHIKHNLKQYDELFTYTSFLNSNYFGFTKLNGKNIIAHYKKAYPNKKIDGVIFVKSDILKYLIVDGEKIVWKMEIMNYKNLVKKKKGELKQGIKQEYLSFVKKIILSSKKDIATNFIKNYDIIRKQGLIRVYIPGISKKFQSFLKEQKFIYYNDNKSAYLFFYNVGDNKSSKFVDHIVTLNDKVLINPKKLPLQKGINTISYKNIFNEDDNYYKLLEKEKVDKKSFLWWKDTENYDSLLIVPKNCKKYQIGKKRFIVNCK